jgi:hypothetical protein
MNAHNSYIPHNTGTTAHQRTKGGGVIDEALPSKIELTNGVTAVLWVILEKHQYAYATDTEQMSKFETVNGFKIARSL